VQERRACLQVMRVLATVTDRLNNMQANCLIMLDMIASANQDNAVAMHATEDDVVDLIDIFCISGGRLYGQYYDPSMAVEFVIVTSRLENLFDLKQNPRFLRGFFIVCASVLPCDKNTASVVKQMKGFIKTCFKFLNPSSMLFKIFQYNVGLFLFYCAEVQEKRDEALLAEVRHYLSDWSTERNRMLTQLIVQGFTDALSKSNSKVELEISNRSFTCALRSLNVIFFIICQNLTQSFRCLF